MSDYIYTIVIFSTFLIALMYIIAYYSTFISNCDGIVDGPMTLEDCCKQTWTFFWSSVPATLYIILICVILSFIIFYRILS